MKLKLWAAFGTLFAAALGVQAQQNSRTPDPADASVVVPPTNYVSVMTNYSPTVKRGVSPDKNWRAANAAVADQSAHAGHASHGDHSGQAAHDAAPVQMPPGLAPVEVSKDHHKHH